MVLDGSLLLWLLGVVVVVLLLLLWRSVLPVMILSQPSSCTLAAPIFLPRQTPQSREYLPTSVYSTVVSRHRADMESAQ